MSVKLAEGVYWVGAIDWNLRYCGSYQTPLGTTYNAYLIVDKKIVLIDGVKHTHSLEMIKRVKEVVDPKDINYLIVNHAEPDHAGNIEDVLKLAPKAEIICSKRAEDSLAGYYKIDRPLKIVKTGDTLNIGNRNLVFVEAQMLHWPDNMMTYLKENHILFSNDPFGQHIASPERFVDDLGEQIVMDHAARYYAQIVLPYSQLVLKKLEEVKNLKVPIDMICPAHGLIWNKKPERIINAYAKWASGEAENRAVIIFDTMWGSTDMMAREISRGLMDNGVQTTMYPVRFSDWGLIIRDVMLSKIILVGSATLNMTMMPSIRGILEFIKGLRPPGKKVAAAFESYGWGGGAYKNIIPVLQEMKFEVVEPGPRSKWVPQEEKLKECYEFGKQLAQKIK